jgi:hypothetical protein
MTDDHASTIWDRRQQMTAEGRRCALMHICMVCNVFLVHPLLIGISISRASESGMPTNIEGAIISESEK